MKHLFIINPAAGSRDRTKEYSVTIHDICSARGLDYRIEVSKAPGECTRIAREAARTGEAVRIYACGGDGTLNEVAAGAAGYPNAAVTVFSGGSGIRFRDKITDNNTVITKPYYGNPRMPNRTTGRKDGIRHVQYRTQNHHTRSMMRK